MKEKGCIKWHAWKVWSEENIIEYEDERGRFQIFSNTRDIDGSYIFYVRTITCTPLWKGAIKRIEYMGEI